MFDAGNLEIFYPDEFYSNLIGWEKTALKIILNDTDIAYELKNFPIEN